MPRYGEKEVSGGIWVTHKPIFTEIGPMKCLLFYEDRRIIGLDVEEKRRIFDIEAHTSMVTGLLAFKAYTASADKTMLLASSSVCGSFKIWKLSQKQKYGNTLELEATVVCEEQLQSSIYEITAAPSSVMNEKGYSIYAILKKLGSADTTSNEFNFSDVRSKITSPICEIARFDVSINSSDVEPTGRKHRRRDQLCVSIISCFTCESFQTPECLSVSSTGNYIAFSCSRELIVYSCLQNSWIRLVHSAQIKCLEIHPFDHFVVTGDHYGRLVRWYCLNMEVFNRSLAVGVEGEKPSISDTTDEESKTQRTSLNKINHTISMQPHQHCDSMYNAVEYKFGRDASAAQEEDSTANERSHKDRKHKPGSSNAGSNSSKINGDCYSHRSKLLCPTSTFHWHAHAVNCLCFTSDGLYLLSGGEEAVLVIWNVERPEKQFLPRLGAPLLHIACSGDDRHYCLSISNNSFHIIDSIRLCISTTICGIDLPLVEPHANTSPSFEERDDDGNVSDKHTLPSTLKQSSSLSYIDSGRYFVSQLKSQLHSYTTEDIQTAPVMIQPLCDPLMHTKQRRREIATIHSTKERIQLYDLKADRHITHIELSNRQYVSRVNDAFGAEWEVGQVAFSSDGKTLVTSLSRYNLCYDDIATKRQRSHTFEEVTTLESKKIYAMNFWRIESDFIESLFNEETLFDVKAEVELQTRVENPHFSDITAILPHKTDSFFLSFSLDSLFKGWKLTPNSTDTNTYTWMCISVGSFQNYPCIASAISMDSSVFAISHGFVVSLWQNANNTLIHTLALPTPIHERTESDHNHCICKAVDVLENQYGAFLLATTSEKIIVWDLMDYRIVFAKEIDGLIDMQIVEHSMCSLFAIVSAHDDEQLSHQISLYSFDHCVSNSGEDVKPFAVNLVNTERRVEHNEFILAGYFAPENKQTIAGSTKFIKLFFLTSSFQIHRKALTAAGIATGTGNNEFKVENEVADTRDHAAVAEIAEEKEVEARWKETDVRKHPLCQEYLSSYYRSCDISTDRRSRIEKLEQRGPSHLSVPPTLLFRMLLKEYAYPDAKIAFDIFESESTPITGWANDGKDSHIQETKRNVKFPKMSLLQSLVDSA